MVKRGQVTIFIIIGILIVVIGILVYLFYPKISPGGEPQSKNPTQFIQSCIEEDIEDAVEILSKQGGSIEPEHYFLYESEKIEYLCYTNENYQMCVVEQPLLRLHIEEQIKEEIKSKVSDCFDSLVESYKKKRYSVKLDKGETIIELLPKRVVATFNHTLTLTRDGSEKFETFRVVLNNNLYELVSIADNIVTWEATYGDVETTNYMNYYRDLKVEKKTQTEGTKIYILTNRDTGEKFQFASRSRYFPGGLSL